jgi:hypothetical protein
MAEILSKATRALARKAPVAAFAADEEYLRVDDFARRMNVKTKTARNWISLGRVKTIRFSAKAIRVPLSELNRLIEEGTRPAREKDCA